MDDIPVECTSSIAAASIGTLGTSPPMIWAAGNSAPRRHGSHSSSCTMAKQQRMLSLPSSRREESYQRSESTTHASSTAVTATATTTSAFTLSSPLCDMGVTQGCRQYISNECKEEKRQYFLQQQCPQRMSWVRICGSGLSAMASFDESAVNSLRASRSLLNVIAASSGSWEDPRDSLASTGHGGAGQSTSGSDSTVPPQDASLSSSGNSVGMDSEVVLHPPARFGHTAVLYKDSQILIFGGKSSEEHYFNDVYQYDASARRWSCLQEECIDEVAAAARGQPPRQYFQTDTMYILSGEQLGRYFDDLWALDIPSLTWNKECGLPFSPRKGHTMHLLPADFTATRARQDMLVVFGGLVKASRVRPRPADPELPTRNQGDTDFACAPTNAVLLYYPTQRRWCQLKTCGEQPSARFYHVSQLVTGTALLLVFGGRSATPAQTGDGTAAATEGAFLNDLHILDVSTGFWRHIRDVTGDIPSPRMCAASVFVNETFGVFAGGGDTYCEDAFEFSLQSRRWRRLKPNNQPACSRPTVTYTKDRLVFFGGFAPRTGVMSCTMELCLSPLSLKSQCLLWWSRCAFEKHIRSCTKSRAAEMEDKVTVAAAMERNGSGWCTGCGGQVTLQCSPAATAHSSPIATPRSWGVSRGFRRPAPLRVPSFDQSGTVSAAAPAWGGGPPAAQSSARGALTLSPTPSYSPSSPAVFSPLAGGPKLTPSWQDAAGSNTNLTGGGTVHASGCGGTATVLCSPASVAPPAQNLFPSRPGTVMSSSCSPSQAGSPATVSAAASTSQAHLWPNMALGSVVCGGGGGSSSNTGSAIAHPRGNAAVAMADADVMTGAADGTRWCSAPSSLPPPVTATAEQPASACFIANCARHLGGYVQLKSSASASPRRRALTSSGGREQRAQGWQWKLVFLSAYAPAYDSSAGVVGYRQSSPFVRRSNSIPNGGGSAFVIPQQQLHTSTQLAESTSSRASSAHSTRSASTMSAAHLPNTYAKHTIQRLEGMTGPYLLQALAARLKRHEAEASTDKRSL
ncbi:Galactose oxidase, central domain family protein [Leishmania donovani]|uniref:Galactose oxidase, central domain family protein n=1 Tax=Leishmania donovani TaxID=5661 RepID=A0A504X725_LEIDO|nr:Galactose oxidase, central domain family protein [Leishmania donovani]